MDKFLNEANQGPLEAAVRQLRRLGLKLNVRKDVNLSGGRIADAELTIRYGGQTVSCIAEQKRHLRPSTLGAVLHQLNALGRKPLLVADYVSPAMADRLRDKGVWFADMAGNAYLESPPLYIYIVGKRQPEHHEEPKSLRSFQPSGLQVLFALLCNPDLVRSPYRKIAELSGVSHGSVGWVMSELPKLGFMTEHKKERCLIRFGELTEQWAESFARNLRPKLRLGTFESIETVWWKTEKFGRFNAQVSGEVAGSKMTQTLRPASLTLYAESINRDLVKKHRLKPSASGNVEILKKFWRFEYESQGLVPPLLVFADLLSTGEARCLEVAEDLRDEYLNGPK